MAFDEKFRFIFDVTGDRAAAKSFVDVGRSADKAGAKIDGGIGRAGNSFASLAMKAAPVAGIIAGIGGAAMGVVNKFKNLALQSGKFADATGLSVDEASRLIEVSGDLGIEAGAVETAIGKMSKELAKSPAKFEDLGVSIQHTKSGAVDMNETFLKAIDAINGTQNPIERAALASKVFGKGWQGMAELIGKGADQLRGQLAAVSDQKVISEEERAKAERFRDAMDKLKDSLSDLAESMGETIIPAMTALADAAGDLAGAIGAISRTPANIRDFFKGLMTDPVRGELSLSPGAAPTPAPPGTVAAPGQANTFLGQAIGDVNRMAELRASYMEDYLAGLDEVSTISTAAFEGQKALNILQQEMRDTAAAWKAMVDKINGQISLEQAALALKPAFEEAAKAAEAYNKKPTTENLRLMRIAADKAKLALVDVGMAMKWDPVVVTKFSAIIDRGSVDLVNRIIERLMDPKVIWFDAKVRDVPKFGIQAYATGGHMGTQGGLVGDAGPEFFQPASAGRIFTSGELARAMGTGGGSSGGNSYSINVQVAAGANPAEVGRQTVEAIRQYERMAGSGWRN